MRIARLSVSICLLAGMLGGASQEALARQDIVPGSRYTSARGAALGDAFLPLADDGAAALFYNPAAFGKVRQGQVEALNLSMYLNSTQAGMLGIDFYKVPSLSSNLPILEKHPGSFGGFGFAFTPTAYMRGFAFGVMLQSQLYAVANGDGSVRYRSLYQFVPTAGTGVRLAGGIVRLGYSVQWVNQASGDLTVLTSTEPLGYNQQLAQGSGLSHNFGLSLTLPIAYLPAVNLVARNVLGTHFTTFSLLPLARNSPGAPETENASYDVSFSVQPKLGYGNYLNLVLQYRDMLNESGVSYLGRLAAGVELSLKDRIFLRGGWGGGYPSAGLGLKRHNGEFNLTWHSEEMGSGYHSFRDIRYLLQYQVRAF